MTEKTEALRLADALKAATEQTDAEDDVIHVARWFVEDAAAELRRLYPHELANEVWQVKTQWVQDTAKPEELGMHRADVMRQRLVRAEAQRDALLAALKKAVENGCATVYANEDDECGERGCCGVVSYKPHADDCWVTTARAAIKAVEGENT